MAVDPAPMRAARLRHATVVAGLALAMTLSAAGTAAAKHGDDGPGGGHGGHGGDDPVVVATPTPSASPSPSPGEDDPTPGADDPVTGTPAPDPTDPATTSAWWRPATGLSWQWQLTGELDTTVDADVYDVDLFDTTAATVADLHAAGRKVVCYFSAGTAEKWRPDYKAFPGKARGRDVEGWSDERWLDVRDPRILPIMEARLDQCAAKGFDGVEADNVDGYANDTGYALTADDQLTFNRALANAAHERGLAFGLKNDLDQVADLVDDSDFAVVEQCHEYGECEALAPFAAAGKAIFNAEYTKPSATVCAASASLGLSTIFKSLDLDAARTACG